MIHMAQAISRLNIVFCSLTGREEASGVLVYSLDTEQIHKQIDGPRCYKANCAQNGQLVTYPFKTFPHSMLVVGALNMHLIACNLACRGSSANPVIVGGKGSSNELSKL